MNENKTNINWLITIYLTPFKKSFIYKDLRRLMSYMFIIKNIKKMIKNSQNSKK